MLNSHPRMYTVHMGDYVRQFYRRINQCVVDYTLPEHYVLDALAYGALGMNQRTRNKVRAIQHILTPLGISEDRVLSILNEGWIALRELFYAASGSTCDFLSHHVKVEYYFQMIIIYRKSS